MHDEGLKAFNKDPLAMFARGGEMAERTRNFDWSKTPVGAVADWPHGLKIAVRIMLDSRYAMWLGWGPDFTFFYNDAYAAMTLGPKHPWALGRSAREVWSEIWNDIGPRAESVVQTGQATWDEGLLLFLQRQNFREETYHTFSYSPISNDQGEIGGMLCVVTEDTERTIGERRLRTLRELAARTSDESKSVDEACQTAARTLAENPYDIPFALTYLFVNHSPRLRLTGMTGLSEGSPAAPSLVEIIQASTDPSMWPFSSVLETGRPEIVANLEDRFGALNCGAWAEPTRQAVVLPLAKPGQTRLGGFLIAGISPRLNFDDRYRGFFDLLSGQIANAIASAQAYEDERKRAEALAELDRAKTAFFSNVSHEFRTPLTLMLGPVEDLLARSHGNLSPAAAQHLEVVNRNGLRLLRLVNSLLDFSRIEAGRVRALFQRTDLSALTTDLASVFRAAIERAGLRLNVECQPLGEPVFIDREMWEKVVLNLLSNALKFTFVGEISVRLRQSSSGAELQIEDTGTGIPADEIPRLFERFHRIENALGRTHEGSGIGLALVQELVKLHGGNIGVESAVGKGTTFTVTIPFGSSHLPADQITLSRTTTSRSKGSNPFVEEALRWLPDDASSLDERSYSSVFQETNTESLEEFECSGNDDRPCVLVADDNADMRQYVARLLAEHFRVVTAPDGEAALAKIQQRLPDLVLSDVMMPRLDGFGLTQALRSDPATRNVPIIMVSARAGEESRVEGLEAGADDYLVKPFSARELIARVAAHLQMARLRREADESLRQSEERLRMALAAARMVAWEFDPAIDRMIFSENASDVLGFAPGTPYKRGEDVFALLHPDDLANHHRLVLKTLSEGGAYQSQFRVIRPSDRQLIWLEDRGHAVREAENGSVRLTGVMMDITDRKSAEEKIRLGEGHTRLILESITDAFYSIDHDWRFTYVNHQAEILLGRDRKELLGKNIWAEFPLAMQLEFYPAYHRVMSQQLSATFEIFYPPHDRWYEVHAYPSTDGITVYFRNTTQRRRWVDDLRRSETQYRLIVEGNPALICRFRSDGTLTFVNDTYCRTFAKTRDQAMNGPFALVLPKSDGTNGERVLEKLHPAMEPSVDEHRVVVDGDKVRWLRWTTSPVVDDDGRFYEYQAIGIDITDRKETEQKLSEAHEFLHSSIDALSSHIAVLDENGVILAVNDAWRRFADENQYHGHNYGVGSNYVEDSVPGFGGCWEGKIVAKGLLDVLERRQSRFEIEYPCHSPTEERWFVMRVTRFKSPGPMRVVVSHEDVTKRRKAEEALKDADRRKDEFLATLAHELRNPLAPIRNGLQVMKLAKNHAGTIEKARELMERQLGQLVRLVDDLLDVSRISRGKIDLKKERVEMAAVVRNAVETSRPIIDQMEHELTLAIPQASIYVDGDMTRLSQVLANLLNNAAKYTLPKGKIHLTLERQRNEAVVTVKDNGLGIPPSMIPRVFEMFTQVDRTLERSQGGLGIGLSLVQRLVELHGGTVNAKSEGDGMGCEFTINLPVIPAESETSDQVAKSPGSPDMDRRRILVVDDNQDSAITLAMMLKMMGNETKTAFDGLEGIEIASSFRPDVVLLDIGMPKLNGYDTARRIREQDWGQHIVLVAITGWGQDDDRRKSREAGFDYHLVKPIEPTALESVLTRKATKHA